MSPEQYLDESHNRKKPVQGYQKRQWLKLLPYFFNFDGCLSKAWLRDRIQHDGFTFWDELCTQL